MLGTWLQRDPIGYADGDVNLMRYVANVPTIATDTFGLQGRRPRKRGFSQFYNGDKRAAEIIPYRQKGSSGKCTTVINIKYRIPNENRFWMTGTVNGKLREWTNKSKGRWMFAFKKQVEKVWSQCVFKCGDCGQCPNGIRVLVKVTWVRNPQFQVHFVPAVFSGTDPLNPRLPGLDGAVGVEAAHNYTPSLDPVYFTEGNIRPGRGGQVAALHEFGHGLGVAHPGQYLPAELVPIENSRTDYDLSHITPADAKRFGINIAEEKNSVMGRGNSMTSNVCLRAFGKYFGIQEHHPTKKEAPQIAPSDKEDRCKGPWSVEVKPL